MNVCGALDNLAWALNYEMRAVPTAVEDSGTERRQVRLFHQKFWAALGQKEPELVAGLQSFAAWHTELSELRDPGAHRVPIYPVPGIMDAATGAERNASIQRLMRSCEPAKSMKAWS